jgi:hypothetical protein
MEERERRYFYIFPDTTQCLYKDKEYLFHYQSTTIIFLIYFNLMFIYLRSFLLSMIVTQCLTSACFGTFGQ